MELATNYAKKKALGNFSGRIQRNRPSFQDDPEIQAAIQEASAKKKHHWYSRKVTTTPEAILSDHDRRILKSVKSKAHYYDKAFHCCCFNVGLDGLLGLIPGIGDFASSILALKLVHTASKADLPRWLLAKMTLNVMFDFVVGLAPIAGDILDILFKANCRNADLLEEYLITRRMDEIRLEKGHAVDVSIHGNKAVITDHGGGPAGSSAAAQESGHKMLGSLLSNGNNNKAAGVDQQPHPPTNKPTTIRGNGSGGDPAVTTHDVKEPDNKYGTFFGFGKKNKN